jgi:hypothetical protein
MTDAMCRRHPGNSVQRYSVQQYEAPAACLALRRFRGERRSCKPGRHRLFTLFLSLLLYPY